MSANPKRRKAYAPPVEFGLFAVSMARRIALNAVRKRLHRQPVKGPDAGVSHVSRKRVQLSMELTPFLRAAPLSERPSPGRQTVGQRLADMPAILRSKAAAGSKEMTLEAALFGAALVIYLVVRLLGLAQFPIFFFTDEAVQTVMAADFIRDGLRNHNRELLPTYFSNGPTFNLSSVSVYLQVIPYLLFGKSVFVTRAVSALVSVVAGVAIGLILKNIFRVRWWWSGVLLLSITPAWFYHSRTAFETVELTAFYALFLYFYLMYRCRSPRYLYLALIAGALVFYTYSPGQLVMVVTGLLLLVSDLRYHWRNRDTALRGLGLLALLALPYMRYSFSHQGSLVEQLATRAPYWIQPLPFTEKLQRYGAEYFKGLNPAYWFFFQEHDLQRHLMKGYGHLWLPTLPLAAVGLVRMLSNLRSSPWRAVLAALAAGPTGSALVGVGITRLLVLVVPITLLISLGLVTVLEWLENPARKLEALRRKQPTLSPEGEAPPAGYSPQSKRSSGFLPVTLFAVLAAANIYMLWDSLVNGPTWYQDYSLGGMQYGARQVFGAIGAYLAEAPETEIILTPTWTNGTDVLARFFFSDPLPFKMGSIYGHLNEKRPLGENTLFILTPDEYQQAVESNKFSQVRIEKILPYPNHEPGFYFLRLAYAENIDEILAAEREQRKVLLEDLVDIGEANVLVRHSHLDMGEIGLLFDGDDHTLARTLEANPFLLELAFDEPVPVQQVSLIVGSIEAGIRIRLLEPGAEKPVEFYSRLQGTVSLPEVTVELEKTYTAQSINLEVTDLHQPEPGHVHLWEVRLK